MAPKKDFGDTIKDFGKKIKQAFRVENETPAGKNKAPVSTTKLPPVQKKPLSAMPNKQSQNDPSEETVVFSDDMTKQFTANGNKSPLDAMKKNFTPKKEMTQDIPIVGKRSFFKARDKKPNFALGVILTTVKMGFVAMIVVVAILFGSLFGIANAYLGTTPELDVSKIESQNENTKIYYQDGRELATYTGLENREWAGLEEIPKDLQNAVIALEDIRFRQHNGIDLRRLMGAFVSNLSEGKTEGGSTITQQLVKNELLTSERSYKRKLQEAFLATELEKTYSKDEILEAYLNAIPLGGTVYGVKAAAKDYFNKDLSQLTLKEMICLASITQNPTQYNPRRATYTKTEYLPNLINRMNIDAERMYWNGDITKEQYDEVMTPAEEYLAPECLAQGEDGKWKLAEGAKMVLKEGYIDTWKAEMNILEHSPVRSLYDYPHFVEYLIYDVQTFFLEKEGLEDTKANRSKVDRELQTGGYKIYATIDEEIQRNVQDTLANWEEYPDMDPAVKKDGDGNPYEIIQPQAAAVVVENTTGELKAIIGSRTTPDQMKTQNRAYNAQLMVGSSAKPISVYGPAFELGYGEGSYVPNIDQPINGWLGDDGKPTNPKITGDQGPMTIKDAIVGSRNVAAAQTIMNYVGVNTSVEYLYKLGVSENSLVSPITGSDMRTGSGLALGVANITPIEMAGAYATIARGGEYKQPVSFTQVLDSKNNVVIDTSKDREEHEAFSPATCFMLTDCLVEAVNSGTGSRANLDGMTTAGKTGTNDSNRGMFFAGYTPYYTSTLWVGNDDYNIPLPRGAASSVTAPIWKAYMQKIHEGREDKPIMTGTFGDYGIEEVTVCKYSNKKPSTGACVRVTALMPANSPLLSQDCDVCVSSSSDEVKICGQSGLRFVDGKCPESSAIHASIYTRSFAKGSPYENYGGGTSGTYIAADGSEQAIPTESCNLDHLIATPTPSNPIPTPTPRPVPTPTPAPTPTQAPTQAPDPTAPPEGQ